MSIGIREKQVLYDNPCAPIVKFSQSNDDTYSDEDDMTDEQPLTITSNDTLLNPPLGS